MIVNFPNALDGFFATTYVSVEFTAKASDFDTGSIALTKTGYTPIAVAGFVNMSLHKGISIEQAFISGGSEKSLTVGVVNSTASPVDTKICAYILWMKTNQ